MTATQKGALAGAFVGIAAAATNWDGNVIAAISAIAIGGFIGWAIGHRFM